MSDGCRRGHGRSRPSSRCRQGSLSLRAEECLQLRWQGHGALHISPELPPESIKRRWAEPRFCEAGTGGRGLAEAELASRHLLQLLEHRLRRLRGPVQGHVPVEHQREVLSNRQVAQQQALGAARVKGRSHPAEHRVTLLVRLDRLLDDVRLIPLQRIHTANAAPLGGALLTLFAVLLVHVRGAEPPQHPVRVGVHAVHAAGVDPRRGLDRAAGLVEAVLLLSLPRSLSTHGLACAAAGRAACCGGGLALAAAHEAVHDVVHVIDEVQVEGILGRDLVLIDHLHTFRIQIPQGVAHRWRRRHG
mmetsp:Transcript_53944/g.157431  ORF Transcript_53944/g.157431 Transcript_53944/m.157431 type:complete len:303 (-) Transcript_53944:47-955(-)